jgi:hypothetical protein
LPPAPKRNFSDANSSDNPNRVITTRRFSRLGRALQGSGSGINRFPKRMFIISLLRVLSQGFEANHGIKTWKIYHYEASCTI